jgi:hypothetical protein
MVLLAVRLLSYECGRMNVVARYISGSCRTNTSCSCSGLLLASLSVREAELLRSWGLLTRLTGFAGVRSILLLVDHARAFAPSEVLKHFLNILDSASLPDCSSERAPTEL